jgi:hypothetical protein
MMVSGKQLVNDHCKIICDWVFVTLESACTNSPNSHAHVHAANCGKNAIHEILD